MSLDFSISVVKRTDVYSGNITHNLNTMAEEAGIYKVLWRPEETTYKTAGEIIPILYEGLKKLEDDPNHFKRLNPENGWGSYEAMVNFVKEVIAACEENPDGEIHACR